MNFISDKIVRAERADEHMKYSNTVIISIVNVVEEMCTVDLNHW